MIIGRVKLRWCAACAAGSTVARCWLCQRPTTEFRLVPDHGLPFEDGSDE